MLDAKFQAHRTSGSRKEDFFKKFFFAIYGRCDHLGIVTTIYIFPWKFNMLFGFDWSSSFRGDL